MAIVFTAPSRAYQDKRIPSEQKTVDSGYTLSQPAGLARTKTGGMATVFPGHPFPRKTFIYYGVTEPNNKAKRITLALFLPFASLRHGLNAFLNAYCYNYNRLIESIYNDLDQTPYLHYEYYSEFSKSLWDFVYLFLKRLGIKDEIAYRTGLNIATQIEYDDAYKVRLQDILNEANREALINNPRKEILRLLEIYKQREPYLFEEKNIKHVGARMVGMVKLLNFILYIPWIKNAFVFAVKNVNFEWFKCDEWDYYWALPRGDYNCFGKSFDERKQIAAKMILEYLEKMNPGTKFKIIDLGDKLEVRPI